MTSSGSAAAFTAARDEGRAALVGYLPVGHPDVPTSCQAFRALCGVGGEHPGVDLVEIGMPYSDPVMDGTTVQRATTRALAAGVRTRDIFTAVEAVAETGTPAVVMIYWNLVERYGVDAFARDLAQAGGSGLITPDLTPDEAEPWIAASEAHDLDRIFLVSPSSSDERLAMTLQQCRGWVYATALMGVTGTRNAVSSMAPDLVARIRATDPEMLVGVGLGVANGEQAGEVGSFADGVIVGSALVQTLLEAQDAGRPDDLSALHRVVADLADGVRRGRRSV
ncbi:MAG TPA: tryptophan synthase subunit alpha [Candidatus Avipropionibacterium avicola]|uniref:Tryptophan synthase alpha chain n=1 Tax=Candidatus Avipropionibacterium avicola TaxID=2840701 RepID=A0A9D1KLV5_9ACTN|nr:tryptophan synthase subunit alpha [Candidatus Avipropionibacterium avicola]